MTSGRIPVARPFLAARDAGKNDRATMKHAALLALATLCAAVPSTSAQVSTGKHLYTKPDKSAKGGIKATIAQPAGRLVDAFAMPAAEPGSVYRARVTGADRAGFVFTGLPVGKYDLLLVFNDAFYEGLTLSRRGSDLSEEDHRAIETIVNKSEPYYLEKTIHRLEGQAGEAGKARCICTFFRKKASIGFVDGKTYPDHRRSLKLVLLEHVGPGWQVVKTREVHTVMVKPGTGELAHKHRRQLAGIRVLDKMKDLGEINLAKTGSK